MARTRPKQRKISFPNVFLLALPCPRSRNNLKTSGGCYIFSLFSQLDTFQNIQIRCVLPSSSQSRGQTDPSRLPVCVLPPFSPTLSAQLMSRLTVASGSSRVNDAAETLAALLRASCASSGSGTSRASLLRTTGKTTVMLWRSRKMT